GVICGWLFPASFSSCRLSPVVCNQSERAARVPVRFQLFAMRLTHRAVGAAERQLALAARSVLARVTIRDSALLQSSFPMDHARRAVSRAPVRSCPQRARV